MPPMQDRYLGYMPQPIAHGVLSGSIRELETVARRKFKWAPNSTFLHSTLFRDSTGDHILEALVLAILRILKLLQYNSASAPFTFTHSAFNMATASLHSVDSNTSRMTALEKEDKERDAAFNKILHGKSAQARGGIAAMRSKDKAAQEEAVSEYFKVGSNTCNREG